MTYEALLARALEADVVYLGERHDNVEHHARQLRLLSSMIEAGVQPALGFEFFDVGQTGFLAQYVSGQRSGMQLGHGKSGKTPEQWLREQLGWQDQEDEYWGFYFQLIELAREHRLPIFGADLPAGIKLRISRSGLEGLNAIERQQLVRTGLDDPAYRALMYEQFKAGHCGWGMEPLLTRLYETWLARNDRMAASVVAMHRARPEAPVVLIVGSGHVRRDQGVPERAQFLAKEPLTQLNIGMQEIRIEPTPLADYMESLEVEGKVFAPPHQVLWFSQRQDYDDPCAALNKPAQGD
nr:ChaN family lipoprotein [Motiliproteus sp. SC1-56]